ncbi:HAMP domain-containing sensor histidine kinase [Streptomyces sp. MS1.AVA.1]|uniref:histidine kinase n=1 Tax=Streptomyces machairae TaxID=3134109 RepID=A0ABU8UFB0_9ACTN
MFRSAFEAAGLTLEVDCPPLAKPVSLDREMWEKIILNLLSNALKFTFTGGARVQVAAAGDRARLTVTDTGTGIPADELPRLFERFYRVRGARSRSHEGSGLGLVLVKDLVEAHGGTVGVDSRLGQGTSVTVDLPFAATHRPHPDRPAADAGSPGKPPGKAEAADPAAPRPMWTRRWAGWRPTPSPPRPPPRHAPRTPPRPTMPATPPGGWKPTAPAGPACWSSTTTPTCAPTSPSFWSPTTTYCSPPTAGPPWRWPWRSRWSWCSAT